MQINKEQARASAGAFSFAIVGWFRFRSNSTLRPSMKETILTSQLLNHVFIQHQRKQQQHHSNVPQLPFLFGLFTRSSSSSSASLSLSQQQPFQPPLPSTHSVSYCFWNVDNRQR